MADMMKVLLSTQAAAAVWGEGALLSFSGEETLIDLAPPPSSRMPCAPFSGQPADSNRVASSG